MARVAPIDALVSLKTTGKFGYSGGFGMLRNGKARYGFYHKWCGIYHIQTSSTGKFQAIVNFYTPTNPRTPAQQAQRARYGAAIGAYRALTDAQKKYYAKAGSTRGLRGYEYFVKKYILAH